MPLTLNTRIKLKYDTLANWEKSDLLLKQGEIALAELEDGEVEIRAGHGYNGCTWKDSLPLFSNTIWTVYS